ncbi:MULTISPECIES: methyltransferase domain-containing protein [Spirulina sp. CCY15215]|uniref:class I SAM-dependent methyltransferase n=1 Tax=Spirulina sp. CCY15215 TaxID=2767591 RepID=UPI001EF2A8F0|nr:methyltransferase domain-containing protein [Spirulina major]
MNNKQLLMKDNPQQITNNKQPICLHIGCGLIIAEGWKNIDASPSLRLVKIPIIGRFLIPVLKLPAWSTNAQYGNIVKGLDIAPNSCDLIYASHVLEHLSITDFKIAMERIYSYLKPQGIFRAVVPNLEDLIATYIREKKEEKLASQASINFMTNSLIGHLGTRKALGDRLREMFSNNRHQWMWDESSLTNAFIEQGFKDVRLCQYQEWRDDRFAGVEHPESFENAICIEGIKK